MKKLLLITLVTSVMLLVSCNKQDLIGKDKAKEIALNHAKLTDDQVKFARTEYEVDDGKMVYEIEFYTEDFTEYDYEIDAKSGEIVSFDSDAEGFAPTASGEAVGMTEDEIKAKLLEKVPGATTENIREFHKEFDDGMELYEGKIIFEAKEYEFEVNAKNGEIISWESESVFD